MTIAARCVLALLVLELATSHSVEAQGRSGAMWPEAREHYTSALRHFDVQQYAEAIVDFQAAYQISPQSEILYGLAQAERLAGDCPRAIVAYESYLRTEPGPRQANAAR